MEYYKQLLPLVGISNTDTQYSRAGCSKAVISEFNNNSGTFKQVPTSALISKERSFNLNIWIWPWGMFLKTQISILRLQVAVVFTSVNIQTFYTFYIYIYIYIPCPSQWPRGLTHELSSLARKLRSGVRIPLKAWMSVCIYSVFVLFCI
jgi:hypothetical protein